MEKINVTFKASLIKEIIREDLKESKYLKYFEEKKGFFVKKKSGFYSQGHKNYWPVLNEGRVVFNKICYDAASVEIKRKGSLPLIKYFSSDDDAKKFEQNIIEYLNEKKFLISLENGG